MILPVINVRQTLTTVQHVLIILEISLVDAYVPVENMILMVLTVVVATIYVLIVKIVQIIA